MTSPRALAAIAGLLLAAACTTSTPTAQPAPTTRATSSAAITTRPGPPSTAAAPTTSCPSSYRSPDPDRPRVRLSFAVSADLTTVTGREVIVFTPDLPVTEVVLRLWANSPPARHAGARHRLLRTTVDGRAITARTSSGGTLARLPLGRTAPAGVPIAIDARFDLRLPSASDDRWGHQGSVAWWATGQPLLAWERGVGWATEPATSAFAEASTSEVMDVQEMTVEVPKAATVLATGVPGRTTTSGARSTHHFSASAVRDVGVAVGSFRVVRGKAGGVPVEVGVATGLSDDPQRYLDVQVASINDHVKRLGPFPYPRLSSAVVPGIGGGIEYPGFVLYGPHQLDTTPSHEVAHEWFYGLVGDDQARDPWLDEALATYVEALHLGHASYYRSRSIPADGRGRTGAPMSYWETRRSSYFRSVYVQGAVALLDARDAVGPSRFDAAIRCFVRSSAHRIARPADLARALRGLPKAVAVLHRAGAL